MKLILGTLALAVAVGYLMGGRLQNLSGLRIRFAPLALIGFALQLINPPGDWPLFMLLMSFVLLWIFALLNLQTTGFALILIGVALNFLVIAANDGMPVSRQALLASGQADTLGELVDSADSYVKHHLAEPDDIVLFLGDVIALRPPVSQAISLGDIFTYGGVAVVVAAGMRPRKREESTPEVALGGTTHVGA
jgi:uncharacterized protein DUF5317